MPEALTALDATFLELEQRDEGALMHIGGVMVVDSVPGGGAPTVEELCAHLAASGESSGESQSSSSSLHDRNSNHKRHEGLMSVRVAINGCVRTVPW